MALDKESSITKIFSFVRFSWGFFPVFFNEKQKAQQSSCQFFILLTFFQGKN
jgi:hypothetical protein